MNTYCMGCGAQATFFGEENRPKHCEHCGLGKKKVKARSATKKPAKQTSLEEEMEKLIGVLLASAAVADSNNPPTIDEEIDGEENL